MDSNQVTSKNVVYFAIRMLISGGDEVERIKRTVKLSSEMSVLGVDNPEKMAQGHCPCCDCAVEVWVTSNGMELSAHDHGYECGGEKIDAHPSFQSYFPLQQMLKRIIRMIK